jgi:hypothetical protein
MRLRLAAMPLVLATVALAPLGCGGGASGVGSAGTELLSYRMDATAPPPRLQDVLTTNGLQLKAACQLASGLPVLEFAVSSSVAASFGVRASYQNDEAYTQIFHGVSPGQVVDLLGPIGKGDGATGTLSYLRPDGQAVTVDFVAMTRATGADCVIGGTVARPG